MVKEFGEPRHLYYNEYLGNQKTNPTMVRARFRSVRHCAPLEDKVRVRCTGVLRGRNHSKSEQFFSKGVIRQRMPKLPEDVRLMNERIKCGR